MGSGASTTEETVKYLNWFNAFLTPHCDGIGRYESTKAQLKENKMLGIMLSNCSAIEIVDDKYKIISSSSNDRNFEKGYVVEFFGPNHDNYTFEIDKVYDEEMNELDACRHPLEIIKFEVPFKLYKHDMMRKK